jgi:hypothetical protein
VRFERRHDPEESFTYKPKKIKGNFIINPKKNARLFGDYHFCMSEIRLDTAFCTLFQGEIGPKRHSAIFFFFFFFSSALGRRMDLSHCGILSVLSLDFRSSS